MNFDKHQIPLEHYSNFREDVVSIGSNTVVYSGSHVTPNVYFTFHVSGRYWLCGYTALIIVMSINISTDSEVLSAIRFLDAKSCNSQETCWSWWWRYIEWWKCAQYLSNTMRAIQKPLWKLLSVGIVLLHDNARSRVAAKTKTH